MSETRLVLIRHGEAQTFLDRIVGGHNGCTGLSEHGRRQADALRRRLERTGELRSTTALYTSILPRAIDTAAIIGPGIGDGSLVPEASCDLCEQHDGGADGLSWDEVYEPLRSRTPPLTPWERHWEGAESRMEFMLRAGQAIQELVRRHTGETIVVVCHGGVIRSAFTALARATTPDMWTRMVNTNTAISEWVRTEALPDDTFNTVPGEWLLARHNDHAHLAEPEA